MVAQLYNNLADSLAVGVNATATEITVENGGKFPAINPGDYYPLYLYTSEQTFEIVHATAVSGAVITVQRAQENTAGQAWGPGTDIALRPTRESLLDMEETIPDADATTAGIVTAGAQELGGEKTFVDGVKTDTLKTDDEIGTAVFNSLSYTALTARLPAALENNQVATVGDTAFKFNGVSEEWEPAHSINVKSCGAVGDGVVDDTPAFVQALALAKEFGGAVVVPKTFASYRLTAPLAVDFPLTLIGYGASPYGSIGPFNSRQEGSWLYFDHTGIGIGVDNGGFLSGFYASGIGTIRNQTDPTTVGWTPQDHSFDFLFDNADFTLENIMLLNATRGVRLQNGDAGRCTMRNVRGQCFNVMVELEDVYDTARLDGVHMWPFWANEAPVTEYTQANTTFIRMWRCDNPSFSSLFSIYTNISVEILQNVNGSVNKLKAVNWDMDITNYGVFVASDVVGASGFLVNTTSWGPNAASTDNYNHRIMGTDCYFNFVSAEGSNLSRSLIRVDGTNSIAVLSGVKTGVIDRLGLNAPVLDATAGNTVRVVDFPIYEDGDLVFSGGGSFRAPQVYSSGTATVPSGTDQVIVPHNLPIAPYVGSITITPISGLAGGGLFFVDSTTITASTFTIKTENVVGANISCAWKVTLD